MVAVMLACIDCVRALVVVVIDGDARLGGERMVGKALDQLFGDVDHGLTVVGFCR